MPEQHAYLSPSASKLWLQSPACVFTPAVVLTDNERGFFEEFLPKGTASEEGTLGHAIVETLLRREFKDDKFYIATKEKMPLLRDLRKSPHYSHYLQKLADWCVNETRAIVDSYDGDIISLEFEKRVHCDTIHQELWGTSDVVIRTHDTVHVVDFKFGRLPIHAEGNPQLKIYAYGACEGFGIWGDYHKETVRGTILQPRDYNRDDMEMKGRRLFVWGQKVVKPKAQETYEKVGVMQPSMETCRYCDHRVTDKAHRAMYLNVLGGLENVGKRPSKMDMKEIEAIVENAAQIKAWVDDVVNFATARAYDGYEFNKVKLVKGRNYRRLQAGKEKVIRRKLAKLGYDRKEYTKPRTLETLTEIEALVGRTEFDATFARYVTNSQSKPKLVPNSSKAQPADTKLQDAINDFEGV